MHGVAQFKPFGKIMAIHANKEDLIAEALTEYIHVANFCIKADKGNGGCFGYPAAAMLFICIDAIGSYHRGRSGYQINIDGKNLKIDGGGNKHYRILADPDYFGLKLSLKQIEKLYDQYRCLLVHNAAMKRDNVLAIGKADDPPFLFGADGNVQWVNLVPLFEIVFKAVSKFLSEGKTTISTSRQAKAL